MKNGDKDQQVLILGATSDMAMSIGLEFAKQGYGLILAARKCERLAPYQSDAMLRFDVPVTLLEFDAGQVGSHQQMVDSIPETCDLAICAFGYLGDQTLAEENWEESQKIISTNYLGAVSVLNIIAEKFKKKGKGTIVGIGSVAGDRGRSSNYIYGSAKAGFATYLAGLRNSLNHFGVHVMTAKPGFVYSKMTSHLDLPAPLTSTTDRVAKAIYKGVMRKSNVIYIGKIWWYIMLVIKLIPEPIFKKLKM